MRYYPRIHIEAMRTTIKFSARIMFSLAGIEPGAPE
jgi:hypothetical protein